MVRSPMQVDENFRRRIKMIQEQIMRKEGKCISIPKLTHRIILTPEWPMVEKRIMSDLEQLELKINFDRRKKL